jgi:hypothetical protein
MPDCGLVLPCSQPATSNGPRLAITNNDVASGDAVFGNRTNSRAAGVHEASIRDNWQAFGIAFTAQIRPLPRASRTARSQRCSD